MKNKLFFILDGNNGATYILNVKNADTVAFSLKFYKARTFKQKVMKYALRLYLNTLALLCQLSMPCALKSRYEIDRYFYRLVQRPIDFELDENSSILISPTRDKITVHHHGQYFHKFAFGKSYEKIKNEIKIYKLLDRLLDSFYISKVYDYIDYENDFCSFKLNSQFKRISSDIDLTSALVEMFNISREDGYLFSAYLEDLESRYLKSTVQHESIRIVLNELEAAYKNTLISVGLVHRDFKPWNISDEHGLLIYDFEEAVIDGLPLEDLFNYFIDPDIRYKLTKVVAEEIFHKDKVRLYEEYLRYLNLDIDFRALLNIYLIERVIFWVGKDEMDVSFNYIDLFTYLNRRKQDENMLNRFKLLEETKVKPGLKDYIWKLFGWLGHNLFRKKPPMIISGSGLKLLNLGSGDTKLEGFVNADFYRLHRLLSDFKVDWMLDLTKPIECDDNYWDGILIEHVNEHLLYSQNYMLFKELFRILRSGSVLRVVVPDLDHYLSWHEIRTVESKMDRYNSLAEAMSNLTQNHAHISTWNKDLLQEVLEDIGFVDIAETKFGVGSLQELVKDSKQHPWQSLYLEAKKP